jgi:ubiquinone/menaquinone biosynthesis C-methylase UbiE
LTAISVLPEDATMNEGHAWCGSDDWKAIVREQIVPWALGDRDLGDDVLEVGPGYGATTEVFSERTRQLTAVEIDPTLASALADRFKDTNVTVVEADATSMTFPDATFTGATCFAMLHHVPSTELQDRIFVEIARVLRPGASSWRRTASTQTPWPSSTRTTPIYPSTRRRSTVASATPDSSTSTSTSAISAG